MVPAGPGCMYELCFDNEKIIGTLSIYSMPSDPLGYVFGIFEKNKPPRVFRDFEGKFYEIKTELCGNDLLLKIGRDYWYKVTIGKCEYLGKRLSRYALIFADTREALRVVYYKDNTPQSFEGALSVCVQEPVLSQKREVASTWRIEKKRGRWVNRVGTFLGPDALDYVSLDVITILEGKREEVHKYFTLPDEEEGEET